VLPSVSAFTEPAGVRIPLAYSLEVHSRPPVTCSDLGRHPRDRVPCLVQHGLLRRGWWNPFGAVVCRFSVPCVLGLSESLRDAELDVD
jgi:hypothetical protein